MRRNHATLDLNPKALLFTPYLIAELFLGLEHIGFFDYMRTRSVFSVTEAAPSLGVRADLLAAGCEFLTGENVFEKIGPDVFRLTFDYTQASRRVNFHSAYKTVYESFGELMKGDKIYGRDVKRDATRLGSITKLSIPMLARRFNETGIKDVADLGCGRANFLIMLAGAIPNFHGVGIEIDRPTIALARKAVDDAGCAEFIHIIEGDARKPEEFTDEFEKTEAFIAVTLFHEFDRDGGLVSILQKYKSLFPEKKLFLLELDIPGWDELRKENDQSMRRHASTYLLTHYFTEQGLPRSKREWVAVLERAGWRVDAVRDLPMRLIMFECG